MSLIHTINANRNDMFIDTFACFIEDEYSFALPFYASLFSSLFSISKSAKTVQIGDSSALPGAGLQSASVSVPGCEVQSLPSMTPDSVTHLLQLTFAQFGDEAVRGVLHSVTTYAEEKDKENKKIQMDSLLGLCLAEYIRVCNDQMLVD